MFFHNISARTDSSETVPLLRYKPDIVIDISQLHPIGTPCYAKLSKQERNKGELRRFVKRGRLCYYLSSVEFGKGGHRVNDPIQKKIYVRLDVFSMVQLPSAGTQPSKSLEYYSVS